MLRRLFAVGPWVVWMPLALAVACASPTLPLPPPSAPMQEILDADHVRLVAGCGGAEGDALIAIRNDNSPKDQAGVLSFANSCGAWDSPSVLARHGDVLFITQQFGLAVSPPTAVQVR